MIRQRVLGKPRPLQRGLLGKFPAESKGKTIPEKLETQFSLGEPQAQDSNLESCKVTCSQQSQGGRTATPVGLKGRTSAPVGLKKWALKVIYL